MELTGTLINYYFHCQRQCWLAANKINMEHESEDVQIGAALHKERLEKKAGTEVKIDHIVIDQLTEKYLIEVKRSDADMEAAKWQLYYYLKVLKDKGMERVGCLEVLEKHGDGKSVSYYKLDELAEKELALLTEKIEALVEEDTPPEPALAHKCERCSYGPYCKL